MQKTLIEEMYAAVRGTFALLTGRRNSSDFFELDQRGLAGSLIAFTFAAGLNALLPSVLSPSGNSPAPWQALVMVMVLYVVQVGFGALALRQFGRLDGLVPYLVASNWATFFATLFSAFITVAGFDPDLVLIFMAVGVLVIEVNIARLIVTLKASQIAMFLIAQLAGGMVGLMILGAILPQSIPA